MNVLVCVDDHMGMVFNKRRQSRDGAILQKIQELAGENKIWIHEFSKNLFGEEIEVTVDNEFLECAKAGEFCFVEHLPLAEYMERLEHLYLFRWNRSYPYDMTLDIDVSALSLISTEEFEGTSHEKITLETYKK